MRVTICFIGGLGNNLFQIALSKYLEELGYTIKFDLSLSRKIRLDRFKYFQLEDYVNSRVIKVSRFWPSPNGNYSFLAKLVRLGRGMSSCILDFSSTGQVITSEIGSTLLVGYWQRLIYTDRLVAELRSHMTVDSIPERVLSVHVRRGDMLGTSDALPDDYYRKAVAYVFEKFGAMKIQVVTDDLNYCRNTLDLGYEYVVISSKKTELDFKLLQQSSYLILSRSTFSWWAARLSQAVVFYPSPWSRLTTKSEDLIIPEAWIPIDVTD